MKHGRFRMPKNESCDRLSILSWTCKNRTGNTESTQSNNGDDEATRERRLDWLKVHREEYAGQYIAMAGDVLVGHGRTIREAHERAKENGVEHPFLVRLTSESEVLLAGW